MEEGGENESTLACVCNDSVYYFFYIFLLKRTENWATNSIFVISLTNGALLSTSYDYHCIPPSDGCLSLKLGWMGRLSLLFDVFFFWFVFFSFVRARK